MLYWRESNPEPEDSKPHVLRARETHSHAGNQVSFTSSPGQLQIYNTGAPQMWSKHRLESVISDQQNAPAEARLFS